MRIFLAMPRLRFPHPLTLLLAFVLLAAALTWIVPAGEYERRDDPATGRSVVVAGTFHRVDPAPVGPFAALIAIPRGMQEAGEVVFLVFLVGAAFTVVDLTGVLRRAVQALAARLRARTLLMIPVVSLVSATGGMLINLQEELVALVPVLLVLTRSMGFDALVAVAVSLGAAVVGSAFSPVNPFQVGIAQNLAQLPPLSGAGYRTAFLALALAAWIWITLRYARRTRTAPDADELEAGPALGRRDAGVLALVLGTFALYVVGMLRWGWGFNEMSALFFVSSPTRG